MPPQSSDRYRNADGAGIISPKMPAHAGDRHHERGCRSRKHHDATLFTVKPRAIAAANTSTPTMTVAHPL
jgi:hypothetical protein